MASKDPVNIDLGNGVLPDGTKSLPEPILTDHQWDSVALTCDQFHNKMLTTSVRKTNFKRKFVKSHPHISGVNKSSLQCIWRSAWNEVCVQLPAKNPIMNPVCKFRVVVYYLTFTFSAFPIHNINLHISVLNGALCDMEYVHCGIWDCSILNETIVPVTYIQTSQS